MTATEWDVFALQPDGDWYDAPPAYLGTLYDAREKSIRLESDGCGSGSFAISKYSAEATVALLAAGNLVKVRVPEIDDDYLFAFFLETGDFTLVSSDEEGGELLRFGGRGSLAYLEYGIMWSRSYITGDFNTDGLWRAKDSGLGTAPGQILRTLIAEEQDPDRPQDPIPYVTVDFDYTNDSDGNAWRTDDATDEFTIPVGDDCLKTLQRLLDTGSIHVAMGPDFDLHAYNDYGRDLSGADFGTGVVRFEKGENIASELERERPAPVPNTELVAGENGHYGAASQPGTLVIRETFETAFGTGTTPLNRVALSNLRKLARRSETITFQIANRRTAVSLADPVTVGSVLGLGATDGFYLPGPAGTNGDFWLGDYVTLHTGTTGFDFNEQRCRVKAITISRDDDNHELVVIPELEISDSLAGLHQLVLGAAIGTLASIYPDTPTPLVFAGAEIATPPALEPVVQDTDGYAVRVTDGSLAHGYYVAQARIPAGLGGRYRMGYGRFSDVLPYWSTTPTAHYVEGVEYPVPTTGAKLGNDVATVTPSLTIDVLLNGTPIAALSFSATGTAWVYFAPAAIGNASEIVLEDDDLIEMQMTLHWQAYGSAFSNCLGKGEAGWPGAFYLTRTGDA